MIVIPMAGLSRRFSEAGYGLPKYKLPLGNESVFFHSVFSFSNLFSNSRFLFICRDIADTPRFVTDECRKLGVKNFEICILDRETTGQAETVELGLKNSSADGLEPLTIFNIDTFRHHFSYPKDDWFQTCDGYLEVFKGSGANWSYVEPFEGSKAPKVKSTTEKVPVSDLCSNGLYHFARASDFMFALEKEREAPTLPELFVAPLYNHLIRSGRQIFYRIVERELITFCGVPDEYHQLLRSSRRQNS